VASCGGRGAGRRGGATFWARYSTAISLEKWRVLGLKMGRRLLYCKHKHNQRRGQFTGDGTQPMGCHGCEMRSAVPSGIAEKT
jgi:hypothetical protein